MPLQIAVGPPRLAINQGHSVLITDRDGQIPWPSDKGLYFYDTRVISSWNIYANGEPWQLLNAGNYHSLCRADISLQSGHGHRERHRSPQEPSASH